MSLKISNLKNFLFLLIFFCPVLISTAQQSYIRRLDWEYAPNAKVTLPNEKNPLWFSGALANEETGLPQFCERFSLPAGSTDVKFELQNPVYQGLSVIEKNYLLSKNYQINPQPIYSKLVTERGQNFAMVFIDPFRYNQATGNYEKLMSFQLSLTTAISQFHLKQKSWSFAAHSVLASGSWYKMGITSTGIYKLTYTDLQDMGIEVNSIDPHNIRIYGNGGAMLPENNAAFRYDDLQENAIYVAGETDGHFDPQDYILFYGVGTGKWTYDSVPNRYTHAYNKFSAVSCYFLNTDLGAGKRIVTEPSLTQSPNYFATTFDDYIVHELDSLNFIKSGREFYGETFDLKTVYEWTYNVSNLITGSRVKLKPSVLARSTAGSTSFDFYINNTKIQTSSIGAANPNFQFPYAITNNQDLDTASTITTSPIILKIVYNKFNSTSVGWLNYFEINVKRLLAADGGQMAFRNQASVKKGVTEFTLGNASGYTVWDATDPMNVQAVAGTWNGSDFSFRLLTDTLREFVAHNGNSYFSVQKLGSVANQDLHGLSYKDMIIVTHPDFESQANILADFHRSHDEYKVVVTKPEMIFNEFSSGNQDPTAIRAFLKMFYDRAGGNASLMPKYILLFGDGSYDNLNRIANNTNFIVTYQTVNSLAPTSSYVTDDYFGFLDDTEYGSYGGNLDISIGRLPVKSVEEAQDMVDKILRYTSATDLNIQANCSGFNSIISNFGDWRNIICFVADDTDVAGENFLFDSEQIAKNVDTIAENYNLDKIYTDAYVEVSTPGGQRYPDANDAINKRVEKGALIMNYIGHGGEMGWAHEAILGISDIQSWDNKYNLPLFITATCEFSRFDDPERTAAGEYVLLNPDGGGIALLTTTRLAFSGSNSELNSRFYNYLFNNSSADYPGLGDVMRNAKNSYGCGSTIANFCLLGDPAMRLAYPKYKVITTGINNHPINTIPDTVHAFSKVTITGEIQDGSGNKLSDYSGLLYPTVFDKMMPVTSRGNDAGTPQTFYSQKNIIYKGKASISSGNFSFSFLVPKDIAYQFGKGKISYYAKNSNSDANGFFKNFIIGGTETNTITDKEGPEISLYLNDEHFVSGGITDNNPFLLAKVTDTSGVNTVGSGIGHDIAAVLDGNTERTYVLNDYYESDLNTYQSGVVRYPFKDLATGSHTLGLKVWDIFNNSSERSVDFVVAESAALALDHVLNYPNPFTTYTEFWFEHNRPCCGLEVQVQIFTISGKLVKTINTYVNTNGFRADPIPWDGLDDYGDRIGKGVYIYKLRVKDNQGSYAEKIEKLVILR